MSELPSGKTSFASAPSLRSRLILGGSIVLVLSLSGVGWAVDRAFAAATRAAIEERLENTLYLLLAVIEIDQPGLGLNEVLPDERLEQPESGLYAGVLTEQVNWRSYSALTEAHYQPTMLSPGVRQASRDLERDGRFILSLGLEWETEDGAVVPLTVWAAQHRADFDQQMRSYRRALWPWLGAVTALIVAVQWLGMWLGMLPLKRVEAQVKAIESGCAEHLKGPYPSELKPLTDNVNALLATERGNRERYRKALGDLAHSLKTPLAVLQESLRPDALQQAEIAAARSAVEDMRQTIGRQLERAVSATRKTHARPLPVAPVVTRLKQALDKVYQARGIRVELDLDAGAQFYGAERDIMEIVGNLLENAYKYGRQRIAVTVTALAPESRRPGLRIRIEDDGDGIAVDDFQRLLKRGERGDERVEGQGLGLAIVAELMDAYDARIQVHPSALGGAALQFDIPPL